VSERSKPILDATAVLALIQDETGAKRLWPLVPEAAISAVNVAEVLAKLIGKGMPREEALAAFHALHLEVA
jgi:PIN domain nuclease of toxin-antitoxin system